jgi:hypothetical protein
LESKYSHGIKNVHLGDSENVHWISKCVLLDLKLLLINENTSMNKQKQGALLKIYQN